MNDAVEAFNLFVIQWLPATFIIFQRDEQFKHIYTQFYLSIEYVGKLKIFSYKY